jgi:hypothetical protein
VTSNDVQFGSFFAQSEPREASRQYLRGLLAPMQRKKCWQTAEAVGEQDPQPLQRLLYSVRWDEDEIRDELQRFVVSSSEMRLGLVSWTRRCPSRISSSVPNCNSFPSNHPKKLLTLRG